jgi:SET domain-containing protein
MPPKTVARRAKASSPPPSPSASLPKIERRKSRIEGWGVFALEAINKNKRIVTYDGEKIKNSVSLDREDRYLKRGTSGASS